MTMIKKDALGAAFSELTKDDIPMLRKYAKENPESIIGESLDYVVEKIKSGYYQSKEYKDSCRAQEQIKEKRNWKLIVKFHKWAQAEIVRIDKETLKRKTKRGQINFLKKEIEKYLKNRCEEEIRLTNLWNTAFSNCENSVFLTSFIKRRIEYNE